MRDWLGTTEWSRHPARPGDPQEEAAPRRVVTHLDSFHATRGMLTNSIPIGLQTSCRLTFCHQRFVGSQVS